MDPMADTRRRLSHGYWNPSTRQAIPPACEDRRALAEYYGIPMTRASHVGELSPGEITEARISLEVDAKIAESKASVKRYDRTGPPK
jgi:hypothetical protein